MGFFDPKPKHEMPVARDPRPDGAQKGVARRDHQNGLFRSPSAKARSPWFFDTAKKK